MRAANSIWMTVYAYAALAFYSGALDRPLAGNPSSYMAGGESPAVRIVGSLLIMIAGGITGWKLVHRPRTHPLYVTTVCAILVALSAWVAMSIGWSADPAISFRRGMAFAGTVLVGWSLASYFPHQDMLRILGRAAIAFIVISAILALNYSYAFHQAGEVATAEHVGRMRGSFAHKNEFARAIALSVLITIALGRTAFQSKWPMIAALAAGLVMMALSGSTKILLALPMAVLAAVAMRIWKLPGQRVAFLVFVGFPVMFLAWSGQVEIWMAEVFSALGKDSTMSGRDVIWAAAERSIANHPIAGLGYAAGWAAEAQYEIQVLENQADVIGHAHNGYLQVMLDVGIIGLALSLAPLVYILWDFVSSGSRSDGNKDFLFVSFSIFFAIMNMSGSYLSNHNDIFTVLLVCLAVWISHGRRDFRLYQKRKRLALIAQAQGGGREVAAPVIRSGGANP